MENLSRLKPPPDSLDAILSYLTANHLPQSPCPYFHFFAIFSPLVLTNVHCQLFKPTSLSDLSTILKGHPLPLSFNFHFHFSLLPFMPFISVELCWTPCLPDRGLLPSQRNEKRVLGQYYFNGMMKRHRVKDIPRACYFSVF